MDRDLADFPSSQTALLSELKTRLREALSSGNRNPIHHVRITVDAGDLDPASILAHLPTTIPVTAWARPSERFSFLAAGCVKEIRATGEQRFEEISESVERFSRAVVSLNLSSLDESRLPWVAGGYSFGAFNVSPDWREFGSSRFESPLWLLTRHEDRTGFTLMLALEPHVEGGSRASGAVADALAEHALREIDRTLGAWRAFNVDLDGSAGEAAPRGAGEDPSSAFGSCNHSRSSFESLIADDLQRESWTEKVRAALALIEDHAFDKIVLARELPFHTRGEAPELAVRMFGRLIESFPECATFLKRMASGATFIGASPERLLNVDQGRITTDALAGSISRGRTEDEDRQLGQTLLSNGKDNLEHQFVVRQITQTLGDLASDVRHPEAPVIRKLRNLQHLHTPIQASVGPGTRLHRLIGRLHPTPAVGGYPREDAIPHIRTLEQIDRGWYSGIVGWQGAGQNGDFAVSIRSALLTGHSARLYAGCGIVESSDPMQEWEETCLKVAPLVDALLEADHHLSRSTPDGTPR